MGRSGRSDDDAPSNTRAVIAADITTRSADRRGYGMKIQKYSVGVWGTNCYFLLDESGEGGENRCAVVDPGDDGDAILRRLSSQALHCDAILLTHGHFDHMMALEQLRQTTGAPVYIHEDDAELMIDDDLNAAKLLAGVSCSPRPADILLHDGDTVKIGGESVCVMHTPGHTRGSVCYFVGGDGDILTGDTLFRDSIGRYDLPGGDFMTLLHSLGALASLEGEHKIYPGHGATSTLEREKSVNLYLN